MTEYLGEERRGGGSQRRSQDIDELRKLIADALGNTTQQHRRSQRNTIAWAIILALLTGNSSNLAEIFGVPIGEQSSTQVVRRLAAVESYVSEHKQEARFRVDEFQRSFDRIDKRLDRIEDRQLQRNGAGNYVPSSAPVTSESGGAAFK